MKRNVTFPDGSKISVDVPENASREDIIKAANFKRVPEFEKEAKAIKDVSKVDLVLASAPGRYVGGVSDLFLGGLQSGAHGLGLKDTSDYLDRSIKERSEATKRGDVAYGREGIDWMRMFGNMTNPLALKAGKHVPASVSGKIGTGGLLGAGFGALSPVEDTENYASTKAMQIGAGGILGMTIPAAMEATKWGINVGKHLMEPAFNWGKRAIKGRELLSAAGDKTDEVIDLLEQNKQLAPGSKPTAAEAASPAGRAELAGLQKAVAKHRPSDYLARAKEQDAARAASIGKIAKTTDELKSAYKGRDVRGAANYGLAWAKKYAGDDELVDIASSPYFDTAYRDAMKIAQTEKISPESTHFLHLVKRGLDKQLENVGDGALGGEERRAVSGLQKRLIKWLESKVPEYKTARLAFKSDSGPINRMEVGAELKKTLTQPISDIDQVGAQRTGPFAAAVRESPKLIKKAGQDPRFGDLKDILTPQEMRRVQGVAQDLARRARYEEQARAGIASSKSDIVKQQMKREVGATELPRVLERTIVIINSLIDRMQGKASEAIQEDMALDMLDPPTVAMILRKSMVPKAKVEAFMKILNQAQSPIIAGAVTAGSKDPENVIRKGAGVLDLLGVSP